MVSLAEQTVEELGGPRSILARQKRDHIELDRLLGLIDAASGPTRQRHLNQLCRLVFPHAFAEESVLWPAIRRMVPGGERLTLEIEKEHQQINESFRELERLDQADPRYGPLWQQITRLLREDVRDEEDRLLPALQQQVAPNTLVRLGWAWQVVRSTAPTRPHPVVARRPPGNALAAPPLTLLDRARDGLDSAARTWPLTQRACARVSRGLARLAGKIEHLEPFTRGEDPATRTTDG